MGTILLNNLADRLQGQSNASLLIGNKHFYTTNYQVHRRAHWTSTIRMMPVECFNGQNLKDEHGGQGVLNYYTSNTSDYSFIFPLLDWQAINGITVEHRIPLERCSNEPSSLIRLSFVGGVSDGEYEMTMMDTATHSLTTQRSWHFYDDAIIALATNLTVKTRNFAWTTLTSRRLSHSQITIGFFHSTIITLPNGFYSLSYNSESSLNTCIDLRNKTDNYIDIGTSNYTISAHTLTIWLDHRL
ncbi:unnamed protein product [Adineta ricciae]|uniref:Polysaccharide lyase family 8 central domain-containing protein n=1 Tax=Adineta ricciae TaxID=249248 RepID=A0A815ER12_ADIRI|nr:unnamed protein product [Adineta ricciae]